MTLFEVARKEAQALQARDLFGPKPMLLRELIQELALELHEVPNLAVRARLENRYRVVVRAGLAAPYRRFAVAHEIGHMILHKRYPEHAATWEKSVQEKFAHTFAASLLISAARHEEISREFRNIQHPLLLRSIVAGLGLSIAAFLNYALTAGWCSESENIWLRIKYAYNKYTGQDPKLRVIGAYNDSSRWFIPVNQGYNSLFGESDWLLQLCPGESAEVNDIKSRLQRRNPDTRPKYWLGEYKACVRALRLGEGPEDRGAYFLILAVPST